MLRRLHPEQPESFAFTSANREWAEAQIRKFPEGRQASAVIPLLWRAQEQEGWVTKPAIEAISEMLGLAKIRVFEVASFYFMFHLAPVGSVAHVQVCGTTSCMICGAEDLVAVCKEKIAPRAHELSADGRFTWEEVECLGACANAPMVQIGKDYYEDLDAESFGKLLDAFARGEVPSPGSAKGRFASEPLGGLTSLKDYTGGHDTNASVTLAHEAGDTVARIMGPGQIGQAPPPPEPPKDMPAAPPDGLPAEALDGTAGHPDHGARAEEGEEQGPSYGAVEETTGTAPARLAEPREGGPDDLKRITGIGPKLEQALHGVGIFHFDQIAAWTEEEIAWIDSNLVGFKGRATRDNWVGQAKGLSGS